MSDIVDEIKDVIDTNDVVLFMKGTAERPMCGFSAAVVNILNIEQVPFVGVDVLQSEELRQGIKDFTDWPTIPQLYVKREFIGGYDIISELFNEGELQKLMREFKV